MSSLLHQILLEGIRTEDQQSLTEFLNALIRNFTRCDVNNFQNTLKIVEDLNMKTALYSRPFFRAARTMQIFFEVLLSKSLDLMREDIIKTIYNIAQFDWESFLRCLYNFLEQDTNLFTDHKQQLVALFEGDKDFPTFSIKMNQFVADCTIFRLIHAATKL